MSSLKKITEFILDSDKVDLMKDSPFKGLASVTNKRKSSAILVQALCSSYDASNRVYQLNENTSFSFCSQEIADVLGIQDSGINFKEYEKECKKSHPLRFPEYLTDLRTELVGEGISGPMKAPHIKEILKRMGVGSDEGKACFKQLMSYYLMEEVLMCSSNSKKPRIGTWSLVTDLEKSWSVNWPKAIAEHLHHAMERCKRCVALSGRQ
nr:protein root hair defective 3 [Tanacetum cinerariifolium]